jgi:hypothetical protein
MDRTEFTVRNLLTAIEAPLYDVGVLSDRGMLPGLDSISAAAVLERLPLLKYRNARGSHIYIRPSGEHRFTTLDDLHETSLARLSADGFKPCAVVETSAGNFQAWLKHSRMFPKLLGTFAAQTLAERYEADPSAADWRRFGRLPGFTNCKTQVQKVGRPLPFRAPAQPQRTTVPDGGGLRAGDNDALQRPRAGTRGEASTKLSFSPKGTEVIEPIS